MKFLKRERLFSPHCYSRSSAFRALIVCLLCGFSHTTNAADPYPLLAEISADTYLSRSGGPITLILDVQCGLPDPGVAGALTLQLIDAAGDRMGTYVLDGLFFSPGTQRYEYLLQPPTSSSWQDQYDVIVTFAPANGGSYRLNDMVLRVPGAVKRTCLMTLGIDDNDQSTRRANELLRALEMERALPQFSDADRGPREVVTLAKRVQVQDFPTNPHAHCVSDIVMLPEGMYSKLSRQQRQALESWVRAGGSVVVLLDSAQRLDAQAMDDLNKLCSFPNESPGIYQSTDGVTYFTERSNDMSLLASCGLGKVALFVMAPEEKFEEKFSATDLRQAYLHLWKIRHEQRSEILETGKWSWDPARNYAVQYNWNFNSPDDPGVEQVIKRFRQLPTMGGTSLLQKTQPTGMQMFPLWLISLTLLIYILGIGPAEYFLLGAIRLRKLTWIVFPIFTVLFTWAAIAASNRMMQGSDDGGRVTFHDITDDGLIARRNVIETVLLSSARQVVLEAKGELIIPVDTSELGSAKNYAMNYEADVPDVLPVYIGSFPSGARVMQAVHKWTPQSFRHLQIPSGPTPEASGFDWTIPVVPSNVNGHLELTQRIRAAFGNDVHAQLIRKRPGHREKQEFINLEIVNLIGNSAIFEPDVSQSVDYGYPVAYQPVNHAIVNFLKAAAIREEHGMYSVVSRLSPKCDDYLEDLPLLDSSDSKEWLLMIIVNVDNQWDVYRKLYRDP